MNQEAPHPPEAEKSFTDYYAQLCAERATFFDAANTVLVSRGEHGVHDLFQAKDNIIARYLDTVSYVIDSDATNLEKVELINWLKNTDQEERIKGVATIISSNAPDGIKLDVQVLAPTEQEETMVEKTEEELEQEVEINNATLVVAQWVELEEQEIIESLESQLETIEKCVELIGEYKTKTEFYRDIALKKAEEIGTVAVAVTLGTLAAKWIERRFNGR